jgi:hypothetical protein
VQRARASWLDAMEVKKMNVPGFNASASLYRSPVSYLVGSQASHSPASDSVQAAMQAIYVDGLFYCYGDVTGSGVVCGGGGGGGVGGGGGRDPVCRPQCGPCRNHVKTCILRNCDDVERAC